MSSILMRRHGIAVALALAPFSGAAGMLACDQASDWFIF